MDWLPLKEAAAAAGIGTDTLKSQARRGQRPRKRHDSGRWLYAVELREASELREVVELTNSEGAAQAAVDAGTTTPPQPAAPTPGSQPGPSTFSMTAAPKGTVHTIVGLFDCHHPHCDVDTWAAVLKYIREKQPNEILLGGDFLEMESCSQHSVFVEQAFVDDIEAGKAALQALRRAAPLARITYLEGNHETRLQRFTAARAPSMRGALTIPDQLGLAELGVEWVPEGKLVKRGHLHFVHGYWANVHHAKKHLDKYGVSVAYGHTHKPQVFTDADGVGRIRAAWGMPCMRTLRPEWLKGAPAGWVNGFGVFYVDDRGEYTALPVLTFDGRFRLEGRVYDGRA